MLFLHVCQSWRNIALSTPALWTTLGLYYKGTNVPDEQLVDEWLARAGALPIHVGLVGSVTSNNAHHLNALLRRHVLRLHHLTVITDYTDIPGLRSCGALPFKVLQKITLHLRLEDAQLPTFSDAPRLRWVHSENSNPGAFALPWRQLTAYVGNNHSMSQCLNILRDAPLLQSCTFSRVHEREATAGVTVIAQSLESLTLTWGDGSLLHFLELPIIRDLSLQAVTFDEPTFLRFARSSTTLCSFSYSPSTSPRRIDAISLEWFRAMPRLTDVSLDSVHSTFTTTFFAALNRNTDTTFLPHLRRLELIHLWHDIRAGPSKRSSPELKQQPKSSGEHLEAMHFKCGLVEYGDKVVWWDIGEIDWDSLWDLGLAGLDIHVGPEEQNFLWDW